ncbi:MAG: DUF58 domain-containing protein, partial [Planctomycetaceae bacterium]
MPEPKPSAITPPAGRSAGRATSGAFIDPAALMRIKNLQLRAKVVVQGFLSGLHKSPYHGFSVEFTEYRQYTPGDDLRYLDWRLFARSDRYYLKRFEDETNLRCWLLVDLSRSMGFGSLEYDKASYARTAAATIAYFLTLQRDAVGLITFDQEIREFLPARFRSGHLRRLMMCLEHSPSGAATDLATPLEQVARTARKRGLVVLLSDLLAPVETIASRLGWLRSRGHEVLLIRILDPAELQFNFREESLFHDLETGRELYIDPEAARRGYLEKFEEHRTALERACVDLGIDLYQLTTGEPLELALFDLLNSRLRRTRQVARR